MVVVYEVNLTVQPEIVEDYGSWLEKHIHEIMKIDGFISAQWMVREEDGDGGRWTILYTLRDRDALENYQANHAKRLIGEGLDRFGGKFEASRRIMQEKKAFEATGPA